MPLSLLRISERPNGGATDNVPLFQIWKPFVIRFKKTIIFAWDKAERESWRLELKEHDIMKVLKVSYITEERKKPKNALETIADELQELSERL